MPHPNATPQLPPVTSDELFDIQDTTRLELYRQVLRLRRFEERAYDLFMKGLVKGTSHLSLGMEAIAAGFGTAMRADDYTFCTYRGHAHTLARGVPMEGVMAELLGRPPVSRAAQAILSKRDDRPDDPFAC